MSTRRLLDTAIAALALCSTVSACTSKDTAPYINPASDTGTKPDLPHFNDITSASAAIQTAARAVVRRSLWWGLAVASIAALTLNLWLPMRAGAILLVLAVLALVSAGGGAVLWRRRPHRTRRSTLFLGEVCQSGSGQDHLLSRQRPSV